MASIKDKLSEKVVDSAINFTQEAIKDVLEDDVRKGEGNNIIQDKELQSATREIFDDTKEYIEKNRDNLILVTKKFTDIAGKVIEKTKDKVIDSYNESKDEDINRMKKEDEGKKIIIDSRTGRQKALMEKELDWGMNNINMNNINNFSKNFDFFRCKKETVNFKKNSILRFLENLKDNELKKQ